MTILINSPLVYDRVNESYTFTKSLEYPWPLRRLCRTVSAVKKCYDRHNIDILGKRRELLRSRQDQTSVINTLPLLSSHDVNAKLWLIHGLDISWLSFLRALYIFWKNFMRTSSHVFMAFVDQLVVILFRFLRHVLNTYCSVSEARTASVCRVNKSDPRGY